MTDLSVKRVPDPSPDDDWLERALAGDAREHRAEHVDDAGFTARVMAALPAPFAAPRWRKPVEWALWGIAGAAFAAALPGLATDVARELFRLLAAQPVSLPHIAAALVAVGAATWGSAAFVLRRD
ncbi:hypothetical protein BURK1_03482 [Burkholderiales bacterium]|nr:hypothetical protein BURK1_03482 [Burkholderiales bacterium]